MFKQFSIVAFCVLIVPAKNRQESLREIVQTLRVDNGGMFGDWGHFEYCADGRYAIGYDMKIEPYQGRGDDTSLNGISLTCADVDGNLRGEQINSTVGQWGLWTGETRCSSNNGSAHFLTSFLLQVERYIYGNFGSTKVSSEPAQRKTKRKLPQKN